MARIVIDRHQAIELLERAVEENGPDYVYDSGPGCDYVRTDWDANDNPIYAPSCIVGHAFYYLGVPIEQIVVLDHQAHGGIAHVAHNLPELLGVELTREAEDVFATAQDKQDNGIPWGEAVESAKLV